MKTIFDLLSTRFYIYILYCVLVPTTESKNRGNKSLSLLWGSLSLLWAWNHVIKCQDPVDLGHPGIEVRNMHLAFIHVKFWINLNLLRKGAKWSRFLWSWWLRSRSSMSMQKLGHYLCGILDFEYKYKYENLD